MTGLTSPLPGTGPLGERYLVERHLGSGATADVYVARDLRHARDVAVKVLKPELASAITTERFLREVEIATRLSHTHILPVFDSGEIDGLPYYVMPLVRGETLRQRLVREGHLPVDDAIRIAIQIAEALAHAHAQGVVHRDVKPENILLEDGQARVADFGVASAVSAAAGERLTATGIAVGTPVYMSPEQAAGERRVDARSDVYSLGCVLYEMLSGEPPFLGASAQAILARKATQDVPSLRALRGTVPPALDRMIRKALARSPVDRFASASELARALRRCANETYADGSARNVILPIGRGTLAVGALTAVALGFLAVRAWNDRGGSAQELPAVRAIAVLPVDVDSQDLAVAGDLHSRFVDELSRVRALRVTGVLSSQRYRGTTKTPAEIAKELNVQALVTSAARSAGDTLHVHVRMLGAAGQQLWAREFAADATHLDRLQKELTREIVAQLPVSLTPDERQRLGSFRVIDPASNEAYQKGLRLASSFDPDRFHKSIAAFEEAIRLDPDDPAPHAAIAATYAVMGLGHDTISPSVAFQRAKEAAQQALRLDPQHADAHAIMGNILHLWDWDWAGAEREFKLALASNPGSVLAHYRYGVYLRTLGPPDSSVAELERARRIDPLSPILLADLAVAHLAAGRADSGVKWAREAVDLEPNSAPLRWALGSAFMARGQHDSSIAQHERAAALNPQFRPHLAEAYAAAGRVRDADRVIAGLTEREKRRLSLILAEAYAARGDRDGTFRWLDVAVKDHIPWIDLVRGPPYRGVASDARYQRLLRKLALPPR